MPDLNELLRYAAERRASDLHLRAGSPPRLRIDGLLTEAPFEALETADTEQIVRSIMPPGAEAPLGRTGQLDFAFTSEGGLRFRVSVYRQRDSLALVLRHVPAVIPTFESLGLPPVVRRLADETRGLLLVTGPAGSGRTTTVAAMVDHINEMTTRHIVTVEDPIEFVHTDKRSLVTQRQVGTDAADYRSALRRATRHDADVFVVGELSDRETARAALAAAATGQLVLSTLAANSATEAVTGIIELFEPHEQRSVRSLVAGCLRGVVTQRLLERVDGKGRIPAVEVLVATSRAFEKIVNPEELHELEAVIAEGEYYGMQTFDQSLFGLHKNGLIGLRDALNAASHPHDLRMALQQAGISVAGLEPSSSW